MEVKKLQDNNKWYEDKKWPVDVNVKTRHKGWACDICGWYSIVSDCYEHGYLRGYESK